MPMAPKRNTAHLQVRRDRSACGRVRGVFTPNIQPLQAFNNTVLVGSVKVCKYCERKAASLSKAG